MRKSASALFICIVTACFSSLLQARAEVYKWRDDKGNTHYSTASPAKGAKPADLPQIMRGEVKVAPAAAVSCDRHGGINCKEGADKDGSVVCYDGFKDAATRYVFACSAPKLEVSEVTEADENGNFSVFVRNSKSVAATHPRVVYSEPGGKKTRLGGPAEIEPFGVSEFKYLSPGGPALLGKPRIEDLDITCGNCP